MRKPLTAAALLLATALCLTAAFASGGGASDPLISLSYLQSVFAPQARTQTQQKLDQADAALQGAVDQQTAGMRTQVLVELGLSTALFPQEAALNYGDILSGTTGLTVTPLAGDIQLTVLEGQVVDATDGVEVPSGATLSLHHRYIVAESAAAWFSPLSPTAVLTYQGPYALSPSTSGPDYFAIARALRELGLFLGTGSGIGEGFDLHAAPTRGEGIVMFIRILGEEDDALACAYSHPFTDVPGWLDRYVAWAWHRGYTNGVSPTLFGAAQAITAAEYEEFLLRALGYSAAGTDDYTTSLSRALALGALTEGEYQVLTTGAFLRAHVAYVSYYALDMPLSGGGQTLAQRLQATGRFSESQLTAARTAVQSPRMG